jgi:hypothetical protein
MPDYIVASVGHHSITTLGLFGSFMGGDARQNAFLGVRFWSPGCLGGCELAAMLWYL